MNNYLVVGIALTASALIAGGMYFYIKKKKEKELEEKLKPKAYIYGDTTLFLREHEIEHFESIGRSEKRKIISRFKAKLARGIIVPVYDRGAIIGYVPKED